MLVIDFGVTAQYSFDDYTVLRTHAWEHNKRGVVYDKACDMWSVCTIASILASGGVLTNGLVTEYVPVFLQCQRIEDLCWHIIEKLDESKGAIHRAPTFFDTLSCVSLRRQDAERMDGQSDSCGCNQRSVFSVHQALH